MLVIQAGMQKLEEELADLEARLATAKRAMGAAAQNGGEHDNAGFDPEFAPDLTPKQMLELGVFGGVYFNDKLTEFPSDWYTKAKFTTGLVKDPTLNFFGVAASIPLEHWQKKGWIGKDDPHGWFQWYARYFMGGDCTTRSFGRLNGGRR